MNTHSKFKSLMPIVILLALFVIILLAALRLFSSPSPTLNVKEAGAKGDGITDDTSAFQRVFKLAATRKGGATILIPEGDYLLDPNQPLNIYSNMQLSGQGNPVLNFRFSGHDQSGYEALTVWGSNIRIEGIVIDGGYRLIRGIGVHSGSEQVLIKNSIVRRMGQPSDPDNPNYHAVISGIMIYSGTKEVTIDSSKITDIHATHEGPVARGIMVWNQPKEIPAKRIYITNNTISHITPREDADGIFFDMTAPGAASSESVIEGNLIHHTAKRGIKIATSGVLIRNNHITNSYAGNNKYLFSEQAPLPQDMYAGISIYASNVTVTDNMIDGIGTYYAAIEADTGPLDQIIIKNNNISGGVYDEEDISTGIRLGKLSSATVTDNLIQSMHTALFFSDASIIHRGSFEGNRVHNVNTNIRYGD